MCDLLAILSTNLTVTFYVCNCIILRSWVLWLYFVTHIHKPSRVFRVVRYSVDLDVDVGRKLAVTAACSSIKSRIQSFAGWSSLGKSSSHVIRVVIREIKFDLWISFPVGQRIFWLSQTGDSILNADKILATAYCFPESDAVQSGMNTELLDVNLCILVHLY
jgi:hypothetical protein